MFSRYKKSGTDSAKPVQAAAAGGKETAPAPKPVAKKGNAPNRAAAQVAPADKERKRKERISEIKVELHKELLDNLNLAALEKASEGDLRQEIAPSLKSSQRNRSRKERYWLFPML